MPWSVERKLTAGMLLASAAFLLLAGISLATVSRLLDSWQRVASTKAALAQLTTVLSTVQDIETGARGYVITGEPGYLEPFSRGAAALEGDLGALTNLAADLPISREALSQVVELARKRLEESSYVVELRRTSGLEAARQRVQEEVGKTLMEELRLGIQRLVADEHARLQLHQQDVRRSAGATLAAMAVLTLLVLALGALLFGSIARDLKRRDADNRALQEAALRIHDLYNRAPCGYHSLDAEGRFVEVNDTELAWLGYTREEVVGRLKLQDLLSPESLQRFTASFARFKETGTVHDLEFDFRRKDNSYLPVLVSATAVRDERGAFLHTRTSVFDNTDRKRLQQERDRVFELVPDLLCVSGFDGVFLRANRAWEQVLGRTMEQLTSQPFMDFVHPEDHAATAAVMGGLLEGRPVTHFENRYRHANGTYRWLAWKSSPDVERRLIYASARDITEQKLAEQQIRDLNEELRLKTAWLESANRELEAFSYSVSHDLRAPLRSIDGFSRVLLEDCAPQLGADGQGHLQRIIRATHRMAELIDDLTKLARVARSHLEPQPVDLSALARDVAGALDQAPRERPVQWSVADGLTARADPALLRIVLENLLGNAWKFTGRCTNPLVEFGRLDGATPATFYVRDNGAGFDPAYAGRLFGAFQRLHTDHEFPGTGIGLATVQRIVHRHGGRVWGEGRVNEGATFYFTLG